MPYVAAVGWRTATTIYTQPRCRERSVVQHNKTWASMAHRKQMRKATATKNTATRPSCYYDHVHDALLQHSSNSSGQEIIIVLHSKNRCSRREERPHSDLAMADTCCSATHTTILDAPYMQLPWALCQHAHRRHAEAKSAIKNLVSACGLPVTAGATLVCSAAQPACPAASAHLNASWA